MKKRKLFGNEISAACEYCTCNPGNGEGSFLCPKSGKQQTGSDTCRSFRYDPLKRAPKPAPLLRHYNAEEFEL